MNDEICFYQVTPVHAQVMEYRCNAAVEFVGIQVIIRTAAGEGVGYAELRMKLREELLVNDRKVMRRNECRHCLDGKIFIHPFRIDE